MTHRPRNGGNISSLHVALLVLGACVFVPLLFSGCSSDDEITYIDCEPRYHSMTIILHVEDLVGDALGEVTVWVDGVAQNARTSWQFISLGNQYPPEWRGFLANWIFSGFTVATYRADDLEKVTVVVTKPGYQSQGTVFYVADDLPSQVYARETFTMLPTAFPAGAEGPDEMKPIMKDKPGEVIGWDKPATTGATTSMFKIAGL